MVSFSSPAKAEEGFCDGKKLVTFGDSLMAGYGLPPGGAYPERLIDELKRENFLGEVVNAGVSGDTTSGGLARLNWSLGEDTDFVMLELGANDALRGIPVEQTRKNLDTIIAQLEEKGIQVLLVGMMAPPNMGAEYGAAFNSIYPDLSAKHNIPLYPFFLEGVAAIPELNQDDGIHPNPEGVSIILEKTLPTIVSFLKEVCMN